MSAKVIPIVIEQGEDWSMVLTWLDLAGTPVPLANWGATMAVAPGSNQTAVITLTETSGIDLDPANGEITITLDPADSDALLAEGHDRPYKWSLVMTNPQSKKKKLAKGKFVVLPKPA